MTIEWDGIRYYVNGEACRFEQIPGTFGDGCWWTPGGDSRLLTGEEKREADKAFNCLDDLKDRAVERRHKTGVGT